MYELVKECFRLAILIKNVNQERDWHEDKVKRWVRRKLKVTIGYTGDHLEIKRHFNQWIIIKHVTLIPAA